MEKYTTGWATYQIVATEMQTRRDLGASYRLTPGNLYSGKTLMTIEIRPEVMAEPGWRTAPIDRAGRTEKEIQAFYLYHTGDEKDGVLTGGFRNAEIRHAEEMVITLLETEPGKYFAMIVWDAEVFEDEEQDADIQEGQPVGIDFWGNPVYASRPRDLPYRSGSEDEERN